MGSHLKEFVKELMWQRNLSNKIDIHAMGSQIIESAILISITDVVRIRWKYRKLVEVLDKSKGHGTRIHFFEIFSKFKYFGDILIMLHEE